MSFLHAVCCGISHLVIPKLTLLSREEASLQRSMRPRKGNGRTVLSKAPALRGSNRNRRTGNSDLPVVARKSSLHVAVPRLIAHHESQSDEVLTRFDSSNSQIANQAASLVLSQISRTILYVEMSEH